VAELAAKASAPVGAAFTLVCLITGALWGQPMWGTWWVWDARLTSMLILFFIYLGYMALWEAFDDPQRAGRAAAILALVGAVNLPVIKFSVDWWNTLHQPASVLTLSGPKIHSDILWPLLLVAIGCKAYYLWLLSLRVRAEILARQARMLRFVAAGEGAAG
jgi:heme exporter protein C